MSAVTPVNDLLNVDLFDDQSDDDGVVPANAGSPIPLRKESPPIIKPVVARSSQRALVEGCCNAFFDLLEMFGMSSRHGYCQQSLAIARSYTSMTRHWTTCASHIGADGWMKFAKYKFAAFFHSQTHQLDVAPVSPLPTALQAIDKPNMICSGAASRYLHRLLRGPRRWSLLASILQLKKGCPRPTKAMVEAQVKKSVNALTTEQAAPADVPVILPWSDEVEEEFNGIPNHLSRAVVEQQLQRTVDELFMTPQRRTRNGRVVAAKVKTPFTRSDRIRPTFPSTSASFADPVKEGGAARTLRGIANSLGLRGEVPGQSHVTFSRRSWYNDPSNRWNHQARGADGVFGFGRVAMEDEDEIALVGEGGEGVSHHYECDVEGLEQAFAGLYDYCDALAQHEPPTVKPVGLAESLKIRVITKGPPITGFVLKPLQKYLWKVLSRHPAFSLIGRPVDAAYIRRRMGVLGEGEFFLSGDYSAATDNLAPWVSECIANRISDCIGLSDAERALFIRSLTQHEFEGEDGEVLPQRWGQLMGSVTSFPVLCIANAALCRWAMELSENKVLSLRRARLAVNGDDCLMVIKERGLRVWKIITSFCGLVPSIGKFFMSREFAQINSANFTYDPHIAGNAMSRVFGTLGPNPYVETPYINIGLLYGYKRSGELVGADSVTDDGETLGARCRDLIEHSPTDMQSDVMRMFLSKHQRVLKSLRVPWFIPEKFGGVGLPIIWGPANEHVDQRPTVLHGPKDLDRRIVRRFLDEPDSYPIERPHAAVTWDIHRVVLSRFPERRQLRVLTDDEQRIQDSLYGYLVADSLFSFEPLFSEKNSKKRSMMVLRKNEGIWERAKRKPGLPNPVSYRTLAQMEVAQPYLDVTIVTSETE